MQICDPLSVVWYDANLHPPPQKKLLMVTGPSGYSHHKRFLALAYVDEEFRPSRGGPLRWQTVTSDSLSDDGFVPTHWALPIELPE